MFIVCISIFETKIWDLSFSALKTLCRSGSLKEYRQLDCGFYRYFYDAKARTGLNATLKRGKMNCVYVNLSGIGSPKHFFKEYIQSSKALIQAIGMKGFLYLKMPRLGYVPLNCLKIKVFLFLLLGLLLSLLFQSLTKAALQKVANSQSQMIRVMPQQQFFEVKEKLQKMISFFEQEKLYLKQITVFPKKAEIVLDQTSFNRMGLEGIVTKLKASGILGASCCEIHGNTLEIF